MPSQGQRRPPRWVSICPDGPPAPPDSRRGPVGLQAADEQLRYHQLMTTQGGAQEGRGITAEDEHKRGERGGLFSFTHQITPQPP